MERDNIKVNTFGLWQTEIYVPPPVVNVSTNTFFWQLLMLVLHFHEAESG